MKYKIIVQYDIFGNVVPQKLCKCGCGEPVYNGSDYIYHHQLNDVKICEKIRTTMIKWCKDNVENVKLKGKVHSQYYIDHPEARKEAARKTTEQYSTQNARDEQAKRLIGFYEKHPEACKEAAKKSSDQWSSQEARERMSAIKQGILYNDWENFAIQRNYCPAFNEECRESNREKYGRKCFLCGLYEEDNITQNGDQWKLSVHHYDMDKMQGCDDKRWKLVPLCLKCHASAHNKIWEYRIMWLIKNIWC